jgi:hypothetical protein
MNFRGASYQQISFMVHTLTSKDDISTLTDMTAGTWISRCVISTDSLDDRHTDLKW